jgi:hypothetical protein
MKWVEVILERFLITSFSYKIKHVPTLGLSHPTPRYLPEERKNTRPQKAFIRLYIVSLWERNNSYVRKGFLSEYT